MIFDFQLFLLYMFLRDGAPHFQRHAGPWCAGIGCSVSVSNSQNNKRGEISAAISSEFMFSGSVRETPEDTCKLPRITQASFLRALCDLHPWLWMLISSDLSIWIHSTSQRSTCSTSPPRDIFGGDIEARLEFGCWISSFFLTVDENT